MGNLIYRDECYQIMGAAFEVYKLKGCGFLEAVYQECLEIEFELQGLPAAPKVPLPLDYKGRVLKSRFQADFIAFDRIIIELKAVSCLTDEHRAQVLNYLHATGHRLGLLINFGHHPKLEWERGKHA
jgi:GxxExxY protein